MISFKEFVLKEEFDSVSDFLLNPEHRNKTFNQLLDEFEKSGGKFIGSGKYGQVFEHPSWKYVIKVFPNDPEYLSFARFAYRNPHPSFPKFYGPPQRIIPFYRRTPANAMEYVARVEKLYPVQNQELLDYIVRNYEEAIPYFHAVKTGDVDKEYERTIYPTVKERRQGVTPYTVKERIFQKTENAFKKYPQLKSLYEAIYLVVTNIKASLDIHKNNIMQRQNGDLVLTDPVWEGSNPYLDYRRMLDMEIGHYAEPEEPSLIGGKLPKKTRKKKIRLMQQRQDDVPF